jgi:hypothetical protein
MGLGRYKMERIIYSTFCKECKDNKGFLPYRGATTLSLRWKSPCSPTGPCNRLYIAQIQNQMFHRKSRCSDLYEPFLKELESMFHHYHHPLIEDILKKMLEIGDIFEVHPKTYKKSLKV